MKKLIYLLIILFMFSFASAMFPSLDEQPNNLINIERPIAYPDIVVNDWLGFGGELASAKLNTNFCDEEGRYCEATKTITLDFAQPLIEDFRILRVDDNSYNEENIRWYKLEYLGTIKDYKNECNQIGTNKNGTAITECNQVESGSHQGWIEFNEGQLFDAGTYEVRTTGEIRPGRVYDWQIKLAGVWSTPWSIWGSKPVNTYLINDTAYRSFQAYTSSTLMANYTLGDRDRIINSSICIGSIYTWQKFINQVAYLTNGTAISYAYSTTGSGCQAHDWNTDVPVAFIEVYAYRSSTGGTASLGDYLVYGYNDTSYVTLNSPTNGQTMPIPLVTTNASAIVAGGASLVNVTLYDNSTGTWAGRNTTILGVPKTPTNWLRFENNLTDQGSSPVTWTNNGLTFDNVKFKTGAYSVRQTGTTAYMNTTLPSTQINATNGTFSVWVYADASTGNSIFIRNVAGDTNTIGMDRGSTGIEMCIGTKCTGQFGGLGGAWHLWTGTWNSSGYTKIYIDGVLNTTQSGTKGILTTLNFGADQFSQTFTGNIDDLRIFDKELSLVEIQQIYNAGNGYDKLVVNVGSSNATQTFNNTYNSGSAIKWNMQFCDSDGACGFATSNYTFKIDNQAPTITLNSPTSLINYGAINGTLQLNITTTDTNLDKCGYTYNQLNIVDGQNGSENIYAPNTTYAYSLYQPTGTIKTFTIPSTCINGTQIRFKYDNIPFDLSSHWTNVSCLQNTGTYYGLTNAYEIMGNRPVFLNISSITCSNGVPLLSNITLSEKKNITIYANDTAGNFNATTFNWDYQVFENSRTFNSTSYETTYESYQINVTANSSLTAVTLDYNGTEYPMINTANGVWSYSRDLPSSVVGNNSLRYKFTYSGNTFYSTYSYQNVLNAIWTICNATYSTPFLNLTFKDESTLNNINASIGSSTWVYYLGSGTETKTYLYTNTNNQSSYSFCATQNRTIQVSPTVQYNLGTTYPQRIWNPNYQSYSNSTTQQVLYLLSSTNGIYVTYQTRNEVLQALSGVTVYVNRSFSGVSTQIGLGTTGSDGGVTFFLNPDFQHTVLFQKTGFLDSTWSGFPTQTLYAITMGTSAFTGEVNLIEGVNIIVNPQNDFIYQSTTYPFNFTIDSTISSIQSYGFTLLASNGDNLGSTSGNNPTGSTLNINVNTLNYSKIYMNYYYTINGSTANGTKFWIIQSTTGTDASISSWLIDFNSYLGLGIFGANSFTRAMIAILVLIISAGSLSYRYGWNSESAIMGVLFGLVWFMELGMNPPLIPPININGVQSTYPLATIFVGVILLISIIKEEMR